MKKRNHKGKKIQFQKKKKRKSQELKKKIFFQELKNWKIFFFQFHQRTITYFFKLFKILNKNIFK